MALKISIICTQCEKEKNVMVPSDGITPRICNECQALNDKQEEDDFIDALRSRTTEERLERIERLLYRSGKKIEKMNTKNVRF